MPLTCASPPMPNAVTTASTPPSAAAKKEAASDGGFACALQQARQGQRKGSSAHGATKTEGDGKATTDPARGDDAAPATGTLREGKPTDAQADPATAATAATGPEAPTAEPGLPPTADGTLPPWLAVPPEAPLADADNCTGPADADPKTLQPFGSATADTTLPQPLGSAAAETTTPQPLGSAAAGATGHGATVGARQAIETMNAAAADSTSATADDKRPGLDSDRDGGTGFRDTLVAAGSASQPAGMPVTLAAAGTATGQPGAAAVAASELPEHTLRTPVHSPAFAPALGAQLTLLIKDGVTAARLHLNPAEMGPISVQIQLDGNQARVEMVAEMAATRQILEQSMPALAGALRDSGLTLTGGGVFEQASRQGQAGADDGRPGARAGSSPAGSTASGSGTGAQTQAVIRPLALPRGMLDLYA